MQAGDFVRLVDNPSRLGTLTAQRSGAPPRERVLVNFQDGMREIHLVSALELVEEDGHVEDANDLMLRGLYGRAMDLRGAITHHRLSGKLANLIYSLNTTNTEFLPYQFKPVLHFLESPSNGILIADEVGLGKTIEAGLIWTELRARQDAKRLLVVCPAMLKPKWVAELSNRFGVQAQDVDAETLLKRLEDAKENPSHGFAMVASLQGLRTPRGWDSDAEPPKSAAAKLSQFLFEMGTESPMIDLVVVDEAHYLRNEATQTNKFAQLLRAVTQSLVLLSATPIQTSSKDLFNLLHLLDEDAFPFLASYEWNINANAPIVALRDEILRGTTVTPEKFVAVMDQAKAWFRQSEQIRHLRENPPTQEQLVAPRSRAELADVLDRINPLAKVVSRTLKRDVQELRVERVVKLLLVPMTTVERIYYDKVTEAVADMCEMEEVSTGFLLTYPQRQMVSSMVAACRGWKHKLQTSIQAAQVVDFDEGAEELGLENAIEELSDQLSGKLELSGLMKTLIRISHEAGDVEQLAQSDSKYSVLIKNLQEYWLLHPDKKVVLFSFYRNTLYYLRDKLTVAGIEAVVLHGGMDKQEAIQAFEAPSGPKILLSSEVAAEGVDLQFSSLLVNYDLPWNPAKIEQRIGRIDRIGQKEERILIWNLVLADTIDSRVYELLFQRLNIFQRALGSMEVVLGDVIKQLTFELLSHKLSPKEQEARISNAAIVLERKDMEQQRLEREATQLIAHGDFIQNKVKAAASLGRYLHGSDLFAYANDYLRKAFPGTDFLAKDADETKVIVSFSVDCRIAFQEFLERRRLQGQTRILTVPPPVLWFDNKHGRTPLGTEKITQDHPLVRFVGEHQRANSTASIYHPAVAVTISSELAVGIATGIYIFTVMRWMLSGSRDSERLQYRAVHLDSGIILDGDAAEKFVNTAAMQGSDWLGATTLSDPAQVAAIQDKCRAELEDQFYEYRDSYKREDSDRIRLMIQMLEHQLEQKRNKTYENIERLRTENNKKKFRLIPMWEGTLKKLTISIETRIAQLRNKEKLEAEQGTVSSGVIRVI
jgi:superfamily II DNA or RNA helicase